MPQPRKSQISLIDTPILFTTSMSFTSSKPAKAVQILFPINLSLCVPLRASVFLMWYGSRAVDKYSGQSYEHHRGWVEERLLFLATVFAIDSAATVFVRMRL